MPDYKSFIHLLKKISLFLKLAEFKALSNSLGLQAIYRPTDTLKRKMRKVILLPTSMAKQELLFKTIMTFKRLLNPMVKSLLLLRLIPFIESN